MVVNPAIILGGGYHDLCDLTLNSFSRCAEVVSSVLQEFEIGVSAEDLILSRIDCTVDIKFPEENVIEAFISCIQRTNPPRGYHIERFGRQHTNYKEMNRHSFRMCCSDVRLTIYDKTYQLLNEGLMEDSEVPTDRLRFEAAFSNQAFQRLFIKYGGGILLGSSSNGHKLSTLVVGFSTLSLRLLRDYFSQHITPGRYLNRKAACRCIDAGSFSSKVKARMKLLLAEVTQHHKGGIRAALEKLEWKGLSQNELQYLLKCFEKINLNPATIGNSTGHQVFPSVAELLNNEGYMIKPFSPCSAEAEGPY